MDQISRGRVGVIGCSGISLFQCGWYVLYKMSHLWTSSWSSWNIVGHHNIVWSILECYCITLKMYAHWSSVILFDYIFVFFFRMHQRSTSSSHNLYKCPLIVWRGFFHGYNLLFFLIHSFGYFPCMWKMLNLYKILQEQTWIQTNVHRVDHHQCFSLLL